SVLDPSLYLRKLQEVFRRDASAMSHEMHMRDGRTIAWDCIPILADGNQHGHLFLHRDISKERRADISKSEFMSLASHQLRTSIHCRGLSIKTDPQLLKELLSNLVSNAIKYTPEGGRIAIRAGRRKHGIRIDVRDSGYGIPLHQQSKVFSKFFRGENVTSKVT